MHPLYSTYPSLATSAFPPTPPSTETTLLNPDVHGAAQVDAALRILHQGDARVPQADKFLADVRASSTAWPIVCALVRSPDTTAPALLFAANTILARLRADWLAFPDDHQRVTAFSLAIDGIARPDVCKPATLSSLHVFGRACGFALSSASTSAMRDTMWSMILSRLCDDQVRKCHVLAAIGTELDSVSRKSNVLNAVTNSFCNEQVNIVLQDALNILNMSGPLGVCDDRNVYPVRAAIACINAWHSFADKSVVTQALLRAITIPQLSDDVAETLSEVIGYSSTNPQLLLNTCQALTNIFILVDKTPCVHVVHHAIAEVACSLSDGNADELMESDSTESKLVVRAATELLWLCLKSDDQLTFFAAVDGWNNWISADSLIALQRRVLHHEQLSVIVKLIVTRLAATDAVFALAPNSGDDDGQEHASELAKAYELFLSTCASVGVGAYIGAIAPFLSGEKSLYDHERLKCMALFALCVTGDAPEAEFESQHFSPTILGVMEQVLDLVSDCANLQHADKNTNNDPVENCAETRVIIKRKALDCLASNAYVVARQCSNESFCRAMSTVVRLMSDQSVCERAGNLLLEIGAWSPERTLPFLEELVASLTSAIDKMPLSGAEVCVRAAARSACAFKGYEERARAMNAILTKSCNWIRAICRGGRIAVEEEGLYRHLTLINRGLHEINDNGVRWQLFANLQEHVAEIARVYCANGALGRTVCRVLETCVLPTFMDEDDINDDATRMVVHAGNGIDEGRRIELAIWCGSLALECLQRSSQSGEACWLQAVHAILPHVLGGIDDEVQHGMKVQAMEWVTSVLRTTVDVVAHVCNGKYERLAEMSTSMFRIGKLVIAHETACEVVTVTHISSSLGKSATEAMRCGNGNVVRECLSFWKAVFWHKAGEKVWRSLLSAAGGPTALTAGALHAAQVGRLGSLAADVIFAMCALISRVDGVDAQMIMKEWLTQAFEDEEVPRLGMDRRIKHMLLCECIASVGSKREFRRALDDVGRVCVMALQ